MQNISWDLLHRYLSGEQTPEETAEVEAWMKENPSHQQFVEAIERVWQVIPRKDIEADPQKGWEAIRKKAGITADAPIVEQDNIKGVQSYSKSAIRDRNNRTNALTYFFRVAAALLIIAGTSFYVFKSTLNKSPGEQTVAAVEMKKVQTARGERAKLTFSDQSTVILNSASTLRYPESFSSESREVYLRGEAYFDIAHKDDGKPFVVHSGEAFVKVLGTQFNVHSYDDDEGVEVVVKNGRVAVRQTKAAKADSASVILSKGQRTIVKRGELPAPAENVSLVSYLDWVNKRMVFEGVALKDVISRLNRSYDFTFKASDSILLSKRLTASFDRESAEKIAALIALSLEIDYEVQDNTIIFKPKQ